MTSKERYEKYLSEMKNYWRQYQEANTQPVEDAAYMAYLKAKARVEMYCEMQIESKIENIAQTIKSKNECVEQYNKLATIINEKSKFISDVEREKTTWEIRLMEVNRK